MEFQLVEGSDECRWVPSHKYINIKDKVCNNCLITPICHIKCKKFFEEADKIECGIWRTFEYELAMDK